MKIFVTAKVNAKNDLVEELDKTHFKVSTKELPIKGQANLAIVILIAEYFDIPKTNISIVSGFSSKNKIFEIE